MTTAYVLAGGGSLGAIQVGMLRGLIDRGLLPDLLVGASVGAINAGCIAADVSKSGVDRLERIWSGIRRSTIFPISPLRSLLGMVSARESLVSPANLRRLIQDNLPYENLEDAPVPVHAVATCAQSGTDIVISSGPAVDALLASAAIPAVFPPVPLGGRMLVDGGVATNTPIPAAVELGADRLIVLPAGYACTRTAIPRGPLAVALHSMNHIMARQLVVDTERFAKQVEILVVPPLCPQPVAPHDFSRSELLMREGERRASEWLAGGGLDRAGEVPHELPPHRHD